MREVDISSSATTTGNDQYNMYRRIGFGASAIFVYTTLGLCLYQQWIADASMNARQHQPFRLTVGLCLLFITIFSFFQQQSRNAIFSCGLFGLIVGVFMFPASSTIPEDHFRRIVSGDYSRFAPFSLLGGACVGTLIGQNLALLRNFVNRFNDSWQTGRLHNSADKDVSHRASRSGEVCDNDSDEGHAT